MSRVLPWPFENDEFPAQLGAVVMRTVVDGERPALQVVHGPDGSWMVADGIGDPNGDGACIATHFSHVLAQNSSIATLATMPPGTQADREAVGSEWVLSPFRWDESADDAGPR